MEKTKPNVIMDIEIQSANVYSAVDPDNGYEKRITIHGRRRYWAGMPDSGIELREPITIHVALGLEGTAPYGDICAMVVCEDDDESYIDEYNLSAYWALTARLDLPQEMVSDLFTYITMGNSFSLEFSIDGASSEAWFEEPGLRVVGDNSSVWNIGDVSQKGYIDSVTIQHGNSIEKSFDYEASEHKFPRFVANHS